MPLYDRALHALRAWLDSWSGIGHVAVGMHRQSFGLQLTEYDERGWWATLHHRDGALVHERDRYRADAVGRDRDLARISGVDEATLRRQRCRIRSEHEHVFDGEVLNRGLHQLRFRPGPRTVLEVVELPDRVARRAPRNSRYRAEAFEIRTVTARTLDGLAAASRCRQGAPFLDTSDRNVRGESHS